MEIELNGAKLRVYECGKIERFGFKKCQSKEETWFQLKGCIPIRKDYYKLHTTRINKKSYITSRIIYFAFNPTWDINNYHFNSSIDHINRDSLDNRLVNLRIATAKEQVLNRNSVINAKGYYFNKGKYKAQIKINEKKIYLGLFDTEEEAHQAYLKAKESHQSR